MNKIYELTINDVLLFEQVNNKFLQGTSSNISMTAFLSNPYQHGIVAIIDEKVVGFLYAYTLSRPDGKRMMYIHSIDVLEEYQNKGIGTEMMNKIEELSHYHKCYKIFVITQDLNVKAMKLYLKSGFTSSKDNDILFYKEI